MESGKSFMEGAPDPPLRVPLNPIFAIASTLSKNQPSKKSQKDTNRGSVDVDLTINNDQPTSTLISNSDSLPCC